MPQILTTHGMVDESTLIKTTGTIDNEVELTTWQEWRLDGEIVKREAQIRLKPLAETAEMGL
jgi:hypothetical protein